MERCPAFAFGTSTWQATLPAKAWMPSHASVGGSRTAASGVPAGYTIRNDYLLEVPLRFWESEWAALLNLLEYGQGKNALTFTPDALEPGTTFQVYLEHPDTGAEISPTRDSNFPRVMELTLTLRNADSVPPWLAYFT